MGQYFYDRQEITFEGLNGITSKLQREFYDNIVKFIVGGHTNSFFGNSFKVSRGGDSLHLSVASGMGMMELSTAPDDQPVNRPVILGADTLLAIANPEDQPRVDIVVASSVLRQSDQIQSEFKGVDDQTIEERAVYTSREWSSTISVVKGAKAAVPVAPDIPEGNIKIAEIRINEIGNAGGSGIASGDNITDTRQLIPSANVAKATGLHEFDAVVGGAGVGGVTHQSLQSALDDSVDGWRILVLENQTATFDNKIIVDQNGIVIVFKRGVTVSKGQYTQNQVANGIVVNGTDCEIVDGRFSGFNVGASRGRKSDSAVIFAKAAKRGMARGLRTNDCAKGIVDDSDGGAYVDIVWEE